MRHSITAIGGLDSKLLRIIISIALIAVATNMQVRRWERPRWRPAGPGSRSAHRSPRVQRATDHDHRQSVPDESPITSAIMAKTILLSGMLALPNAATRNG